MSQMPLVMCLTNTVAANFTANVLLAIGARPAMISDPSEAAELAALASAVLVNVGTLDQPQAEAMRAAVAACRRVDTPWVLDPVAAHLLAYRYRFVRELLDCGPAVVRGNREEISALSPVGVVSLATGETDLITDVDGSTLEIDGGVPMLQSVTATGCAQGALVAAFLGWGQPPMEAAKAASRLMKSAGERAWEKARTPGVFQAALIDTLWELAHSVPAGDTEDVAEL